MTDPRTSSGVCRNRSVLAGRRSAALRYRNRQKGVRSRARSDLGVCSRRKADIRSGDIRVKATPLSQVATVQYGLEQPVIWRRDLLPTITVQADLVPGIEAKTVNTQLASALAEFAKKLPPRL